MRLLIIRHARAADANGQPDTLRPLTSEGRSEFAAVSRWAIGQGVVPGHVFHSPALRTTETAQILVTNAGLASEHCDVAPWLSMGTSCNEILPHLQSAPSDVTALVGHEPTMSALASMLSGGGWMAFRPGTIACLEFESVIAPGLGKLLWLADASMF